MDVDNTIDGISCRILTCHLLAHGYAKVKDYGTFEENRLRVLTLFEQCREQLRQAASASNWAKLEDWALTCWTLICEIREVFEDAELCLGTCSPGNPANQKLVDGWIGRCNELRLGLSRLLEFQAEIAPQHLKVAQPTMPSLLPTDWRDRAVVLLAERGFTKQKELAIAVGVHPGMVSKAQLTVSGALKFGA